MARGRNINWLLVGIAVVVSIVLWSVFVTACGDPSSWNCPPGRTVNNDLPPMSWVGCNPPVHNEPPGFSTYRYG